MSLTYQFAKLFECPS